jgi:uncharacterized SAM-binding protein YcdF (DUF218 family)
MRMMLGFIIILFGIWVSGLAAFVHHMPTSTTTDDTSTDAIIVLTGGSGRVAHGFELLARDKAHTLFISGVGKDTTLDDLLNKYGNESVREKVINNAAHIILDYRAMSTHTNAYEAARFIRTQSLKSVRLVTANYHMPRSLIEFRSAVPDVQIIPDPVIPKTFHRGYWWKDDASRHLVLSEFHKYWAAWFRTRLSLETVS